MIENYLWEELATFREQKTLAKTAEKLHITQPSVTRGMQKLEDLLGVALFIHQPNRITLTKTGELAATEAKRIIELNQQAQQKIRNFGLSQKNITIASSLPGPRILLNDLKSHLDSNIKLEYQLQQGSLEALLTSRKFNLLLSNQEIMTSEVESQFIGIERLSVNLNKFMYQANQPEITFSELSGLSFLVLDDIGIWKDIIQQNISNTKFLYQPEADTFAEITKYSDFPFFSTNISDLDPQFQQYNLAEDNRITIPITDKAARVEIYANYLKNQRQLVSPVIQQIRTHWPK